MDDMIILQHVIDGLPGHVYWKDKDGRYLGTNILHVKNLGLNSVEDMLGKTDFELPWPSGSAAQFRANDLEVMTSDSTCSFEEDSQMSGAKVAVLSQKSPLKNKSGKVVGVIGISLNITELKKQLGK